MKKIVFLFLAAILMFSSINVLAADDTTITAKDLNVAEPTVLPTNPFYFLKEIGREIQMAITLDPVKKADIKLKIASEKLVEAEKVSGNKEDLSNALNNYTSSLNSLKDYASTLKQDSISSNVLLKKIAVQTFNQQKLLDQIAEKQTDSSQKIFESKDKALNSLTNTSLELGSSDKIKEALEQATTSSKTGTTNIIDVLKKVESIVPDQVKKAIIEAQNTIITNKLNNVNVSAEDKDKLNAYLEELKTKTEYKDLLSEDYVQKLVANNQDILNSLGDISPDDKAKLIEYGKSILSEDNIDYNQILNGFNSLNISSDAKTIVDLIQSQIANRYSEGGVTCLDVPNPICGKDNKTYSNICEAKKVGIEIAYKGDCGSCTIEGAATETGKTCCLGLLSCPTISSSATAAVTTNTCQKSCETTTTNIDVKPDTTYCTTDWNPVCGENGKTYSNECYLNKAGVKLKARGECQKNQVIKDTTVETPVISTPAKAADTVTSATDTTGLANPASKFCIKQGYSLSIRKLADGSESGICVFDSKNECEEWAFYRRTCGTDFIR